MVRLFVSRREPTETQSQTILPVPYRRATLERVSRCCRYVLSSPEHDMLADTGYAEIFVEKAEIYVRNRSSMLQLLSDPILDQIEQEELEAARALQDPQIAMRLSVEKLRQQEGSLGLPQLQHTVFQPEANSLQVERKPLARSYDLTFIRYFPASWPKPGSFPTSFRSLYNDIYMDIITRAHSEGIERSLALAKQGISNRGRPNHVDDASTPPTRLSPQLIESLFHSLDLLLSKHEGLLGALCLFLNRAYRLCSCHGLPETPRLIRIGDSSPLPRTSESYRVLESLGKLFGREVESAYRYLVEIRDGDDYQLLRKNIYTRIRKEMML